MSFLDSNTIQRSTPVFMEGTIVIIIGLLIVANVTLTDITFHDFYVLPAIETCYAENQDPFCQNLRERHGLPSDAQLEIGNIYWNELARQGMFIGFILFAFRMFIGWMLQYARIRKIRMATILMAIFWGMTGTAIFLFGFVDTLYYVIQGDNFPNELAWLNNAGLFTESKAWFGDPTIVEKEDLFATNIVGLVIIGGFLLVIMNVFGNSGVSSRNIA